MIKFFRKIRQNLLLQNKTRKYFKYAIGEIILVVIGILIALQISNWNENRKKNNSTRIYLNSLTDDLNQDYGNLNFIIGAQTFKFHTMQYLLKMSEVDSYDIAADGKTEVPKWLETNNRYWTTEIPDTINNELIQVAYREMHKVQLRPPSTLTIEELKSTGMYSNLSPKIKEQMNNYYLIWEREFNGKVQILAMDWQNSLAEEGYITTDTYKAADPLEIVRNNPQRRGLLKRMIRESGWTVLVAMKLQKYNEILKKTSAEELNLRNK